MHRMNKPKDTSAPEHRGANCTENICLSLNSTYSDAKGPVTKSIYDFTLRPDTTKRESVDEAAIGTRDKRIPWQLSKSLGLLVLK